MLSVKETMEVYKQAFENMKPEERYRLNKYLEDVEVESDEELLKSFTYTKSHRESVAATLLRMDNVEWSKMFSRFRREGEVSLWEVVRGDVKLANEMFELNDYFNFLD